MNFLTQITIILLKGFIKAYQIVISPITAGACRYHPTCSQYTMLAIELHGPLKGSWLAIKRISNCHPWGPSGFDPVPPEKPELTQKK